MRVPSLPLAALLALSAAAARADDAWTSAPGPDVAGRMREQRRLQESFAALRLERERSVKAIEARYGVRITDERAVCEGRPAPGAPAAPAPDQGPCFVVRRAGDPASPAPGETLGYAPLLPDWTDEALDRRVKDVVLADARSRLKDGLEQDAFKKAVASLERACGVSVVEAPSRCADPGGVRVFKVRRDRSALGELTLTCRPLPVKDAEGSLGSQLRSLMARRGTPCSAEPPAP